MKHKMQQLKSHDLRDNEMKISNTNNWKKSEPIKSTFVKRGWDGGGAKVRK